MDNQAMLSRRALLALAGMGVFCWAVASARADARRPRVAACEGSAS